MVVIHENENYQVEVSPEGHGSYFVRNKKSGVVEGDITTLPEAINLAEHSNAYLRNKLWQWIERQGNAARSEMEAEGITADLDGATQVN